MYFYLHRNTYLNVQLIILKFYMHNIVQVGKVGKIVKAVRDKPDHLDGFSTYTITNLLGADDEKVTCIF